MCTACGDIGAYVGAYEVKCPNHKCKFYDEELRIEQAVDVLKEFEEQFRKEDEEKKEQPVQFDPDKTPTMPWGFPEFPQYNDD